jgi:hypothetical protein
LGEFVFDPRIRNLDLVILVTPREVERDSQIYRAYLKEAERIGGRELRVQLDFELKVDSPRKPHYFDI